MTEKLWDPSRNEYVEWDGREVTPHKGGTSFGPGPGHKVTPRLVGAAVANFRKMWNLCGGEHGTCTNVHGHEGECNG